LRKRRGGFAWAIRDILVVIGGVFAIGVTVIVIVVVIVLPEAQPATCSLARAHMLLSKRVARTAVARAFGCWEGSLRMSTDGMEAMRCEGKRKAIRAALPGTVLWFMVLLGAAVASEPRARAGCRCADAVIML
jgi:hypothetical protein